MNDKETIREQLSAYLDGELSEGDATRVEQALESDAELRREFEGLRATCELLRTLPREEVSEDFTERVISQAERVHLVGDSHATHASPLGWVRHLATAAVLLIAVSAAVIVTVTLWPPGVPERPTAGGSDDSDDIALVDDGADERSDEPASGLGEGNGDRLAKDTETGGWETGSGPTDADEPPAPSAHPYPPLAAEVGIASKSGEAAGGFGRDANDFAINNTYKEVIYTDKLHTTNSEIAKMLKSNGIEPMVVMEKDGTAEEARRQAQSRANFYLENQSASSRVDIVAFGTPEQLANVRTQLIQLRAKQDVSQRHFMPGRKEEDGMIEISRLVSAAQRHQMAAARRHVEAKAAPSEDDKPSADYKGRSGGGSADGRDAEGYEAFHADSSEKDVPTSSAGEPAGKAALRASSTLDESPAAAAESKLEGERSAGDNMKRKLRETEVDDAGDPPAEQLSKTDGKFDKPAGPATRPAETGRKSQAELVRERRGANSRPEESLPTSQPAEQDRCKHSAEQSSNELGRQTRQPQHAQQARRAGANLEALVITLNFRADGKEATSRKAALEIDRTKESDSSGGGGE